MRLFELHTNLSERHRQIMDSFAQKEKYGNRRMVLERALELLEAAEEIDMREILEAYKVRRMMTELFNFVLVNRELIEGLAKVALRESSMETLLKKTREYTIAEFETVQKAITIKKINSFSDMVKSITFYHKHMDILGELHVNEEQWKVLAKLKAFKALPEIPLEILNTLLEASGYTFDLRLEEGPNPIFTVNWIPPESYPKIREERKNI